MSRRCLAACRGGSQLFIMEAAQAQLQLQRQDHSWCPLQVQLWPTAQAPCKASDMPLH